jgi:glycosyltransferase involved in cell wall biosynthesis
LPSILFVSNHCFIDYASGAALSARDLFIALTKRGWSTRVLSGRVLDSPTPGIEKLIERYQPGAQTRGVDTAAGSYLLHDLVDQGVAVRIYQPPKTSTPIPLEEGYPFLQLIDEELAQRRPEVILSFGGGWLERGVLAVAKRHGIPVVFWLRNTEYKRPDLFENVAGAIVPSNFSAEYFKKTLSLNFCKVIPSLVLPERVLCTQREPRFVTYVSPTPAKGVFYFARIASELGRLRPDIPILIAVGRGQLKWFEPTGLNVLGLRNLKIAPPTSDPREFFKFARVIVAPGLWEETYLRTAVEGIFNGIPTLASRRGGVADTLGQCGFLFDIPARYTSATRLVPSVAEVRPWVDTIQRIFDDPAFETEQRNKCLAESQRFAPEKIISAHEDYLANIAKTHANQATAPSRSLHEDLASLQKYFQKPIDLEKFTAISNTQ